MNPDNWKFVTKSDLHRLVNSIIQWIINCGVIAERREQLIDELTDSESHGFVACLVILQNSKIAVSKSIWRCDISGDHFRSKKGDIIVSMSVCDACKWRVQVPLSLTGKILEQHKKINLTYSEKKTDYLQNDSVNTARAYMTIFYMCIVHPDRAYPGMPKSNSWFNDSFLHHHVNCRLPGSDARLGIKYHMLWRNSNKRTKIRTVNEQIQLSSRLLGIPGWSQFCSRLLLPAATTHLFTKMYNLHKSFSPQEETWKV